MPRARAPGTRSSTAPTSIPSAVRPDRRHRLASLRPAGRRRRSSGPPGRHRHAWQRYLGRPMLVVHGVRLWNPRGWGQRTRRHGHGRSQLHVLEPDPARTASSHHRYRGVQPCHQQLAAPSISRDPASAARSSSLLFAGGLVALLLVAALAFDVGMMLVERRDEQNAADAAALAGARHVLTDAVAAEAAARHIARSNGFDDAATERGR